MGLSSSKSTTKTDEKSTQQGTTTPFNLPGVDQALIGMTDRIGAFGDMDPNSFIAGPSPLQQMAWNNVPSLADWQPQARLASETALGVANAAPANAGQASTWNPSASTAQSWQAPQIGNAPQAQAASMQAPSLGNAVTGQAASYQAPQLGAAPTANAATMQAPKLGAAPTAQASTYNAPNLGAASTYSAPTAGQGALVSARGYQAPQLGSATGYAAPRIGNPIGAAASGYSTQPTDRTQIGATANAQATDAQSQSLLTGLNNYSNPFNNEVRSRALQDFDFDAERTRARQMAEGARAGAFGGSRFGIAQAATEGELARARGSLDAGLRAEGFDRAAALSQYDTSNRQQTNLQNAQNRTGISSQNAAAANDRAMAQGQLDSTRSLFDSGQRADAAEFGAGSRERVGLFNSGQDLQARLAQAGMDETRNKYTADLSNQFTLERAGMGERAGQFNATLGAGADVANQQSKNSMGQFNATLGAQAASENAQARNAQAMAQAQLLASAGQYNAGNRQATALANQQMQGQYGLTGAQMGFDAARTNAQNQQQTALSNQDFAGRFSLANADLAAAARAQAAQNQQGMTLANLGFQNDRSLQQGLMGERAAATNAGFAQQTGLANQQLAGQYGLSQFGAQTDAASQNAAAANQYGLANMDALNTAAQSNAAANNNMSQFNAQMQEQAHARQLESARMLGGLANDYAGNVRDDLGMMAGLGDQQRLIESQYAMAPLAQLQSLGELYGTTPYGLFAGQNFSGTGTSNGTNVTKSSPGLFGMMMQMGENAARAYAGGAG